MFRFINKESKTIVGAAAIVGVLSFASRIVGLVRDRILAGAFGAGDTLDVYYAAFKVPDFMFSLIVVGAISASFIPLFSSHFQKRGGKKAAWKFTNNMIHILGGLMIVLTGVLFLFAGPLSQIIAPGFSAEKQFVVAEFMRVMLISQVILTFSMIFGSVLQSTKRFFLYALAPVLYNAGIIIGAMFFIENMGPIGLAWGVVFGAAMHALVQLFGALHVGYRYAPSFDLRNKDTLAMLRMTGPRMLGIGVNQIMFVILTIMATTFAVGSVTIFQFAYNIQFFPVGIIGVSYAIAAFPSLSEHASKKEMDRFRQVFSGTVRQMVFFLIPMMLLFLILRSQIVRVVVGAGAFDWNATILTADTLAFFALTFIPQSLVFILARSFFALHDTITPLTAGIVGAVMGIGSAFLLTPTFGVIGLAMAYSVAAVVNATLLWVPLRQRIGSLDEMKILLSLGKMSVAGIIAAVVMQAVKPIVVEWIALDTFFGVLSQGLVAGGLGIMIYIVIAHLLKTEELEMFFASMKRKVLKKVIPEESVSPNSTPTV